MTSIKKLKQFIKSASVKSDPEMNQKVLSELIEEIPGKANKRSIIMKNTGPKLALAAAAIFAFAMFTILFLNNSTNQKIEIPAELAAMSAEELVELNYHPENSNFSPEVIKAALQQALDKLSPEKVMAIAKNLSSGSGDGVFSDVMAPPSYPMADMARAYTPFPQVVESTDIFVKARLLDTTVNAEDIIQALIDAQEWIEDFSSQYRVTMKLEVLDSLPAGALKKGLILEVPNVIDEETLNGLKNGTEYYISMVQTDNGPRFLYPLAGFFNLSEFEMTDPEVLWTFFSDALNILLSGYVPEKEAIDYWTALLNTDYYKLAIEYMAFLPDENLSTTLILDAIETKHNDILSLLQPDLNFNQNDVSSPISELQNTLKSLENEISSNIQPNSDSNQNNVSPLLSELKDALKSKQDEISSQIQPGLDSNQLRDIRGKFTELEPLIKLLFRANNEEANERLVSILTRQDSFIELIDILPYDLIPSNLVMDAYERKYQYVISEAQKIPNFNPATIMLNDNLMGLASKVSDILIKTDDKESIQRMISLIEEDIKLGKNGRLFSSLHHINKDFIHPTVSLLIALDNDKPARRLMEIYEKYSAIPVVFETYYKFLYMENPSPAKAQENYKHALIKEIIEQAAEIATDDVYAMLYQILQAPSAFGIVDADSKNNYSTNNLSVITRLWEILGSSGKYDLKPYFLGFISNPDLSEIGIIVAPDEENPKVVQFQFERAAFEALQKLPVENQPGHKELINMLTLIYQRHKDNQQCKEFAAGTLENILQPNDTECIPILQELLSADDIRIDIPGLIAKNVPDSVFIDELIPAYEKNPNIKVLNAIADCGDKEKAIAMALSQDTFSIDLLNFLFENGKVDEAKDMALNHLEKAISDESQERFRDNINQISQIISFMGKTGDLDFAKIIEHYTENDVINDLYKKHPYHILNADTIYNLQENAVVTLTHLSGKNAIGPLRKVYKNTKEIRARSISAICLYYLGDNTGRELIDAYVKGTHKQIPEYAIRIYNDFGEGQLFQASIISSLRSERTDALILEKLRNYVDQSDYLNMGSLVYETKQSFFEEYENQIMPIMVNQLNNRNKDTRSHAHGILKEVTGQDFGFDEDKYHGYQDDIIQQWRDYVEREY